MALRKIPLDERTRQLVEKQIEEFRRKFGREPGPDDPVFFDPDQDTPQPIPEARLKADWNELLDEMERQGTIRPEIIYAARKTGFLATESNYPYLSEAQIKEWEDAIDEFLGPSTQL